MKLLAGLARRSTLIATPMARSYAEGNMNATVRIERGSKPVFNPATGGLVMGAETVVWEGDARIPVVAGAAQFQLGDEPTYYASTTVSIPLSSQRPRIDDTVTVLTHPDPNLVGRIFRVQDVEAGGQMPVAHKMSVVGIQPSKQWEG